MRLLEFQAKQLLFQGGINTPAGRLLTGRDDFADTRFPVVLKSQVLVGGRGKAGGIRLVKNPQEAVKACEDLFKLEIKGYPVKGLWVEEAVKVERELYLTILYNKKTNMPMLMVSPEGGMDIEAVAKETPQKIFKRDIHPLIGLHSGTIGAAAKALNVTRIEPFSALVRTLYALYNQYDATLLEINPLGETSSGFIAMDAKMILDDKADFRHVDLFEKINAEHRQLLYAHLSKAEKLAKEYGVTYVSLEGDVAMIADGAGTGMLTLDLIGEEGGKAVNFCEMGGLANAEVTEKALEVVLAKPSAKSLIITLIGGLTRMDEIADGIASYLKKHPQTIPFIVRMCGTQEEAGRATLRGVGIETYDDMTTAIRAAIEVNKEG